MAEHAKPAPAGHGAGQGDGEGTRRDFLFLAGGTMFAVGAAITAWPLINSMNPAADVLALASTEVDLTPIAEGQSITVKWRGKPVFIRHRTAAEIEQARAVPLGELRDPQSDEARTQDVSSPPVEKPEILILVGVCTHLGCIPVGQKVGEPRGDYGGWLCPCHGSHYDTAGRIRRGPAPKNLEVPQYTYLSDTRVKIG
jgi:ubiquinol-cytochrome c reductase iron-sulfur subunit